MHFSSLVVSASVLGGLAQGQAAVIVQTDFNATAVQSYVSGATINSGGASTDDFVVGSAPGNVAEVVTVTGSNRAFLASRNSGTSVDLYNRASQNGAWGTAAISTGASGNNQLAASFDIARLANSGSGFRFLLSKSDTGGSADSLVQFELNANGTVSYRNGTVYTTVPSTSLTLAQNVDYRIDIAADLSSDTQDHFTFKITDLSTPSPSLVYTSELLNTRVANMTPDRLVFNCGGVGVANNPNPVFRLDNVSLSASPIPEPTGLTAIAVAAMGLIAMRRRRD